MSTENKQFHPKKYTTLEEWETDLPLQAGNCTALVKGGPERLDDLQVFLTELAWATLRGEISAERASELLKATPVPKREPLQRLLTDVLWLVGFSATEAPNNKETRETFQDLCGCLEKYGVVSREIMALGLETDTIPQAVCQNTMLKKKQNQAKTKARYTITRYNILREHSEGYSKLAFLLGRLGSLEFEPVATEEQLSQTAERLADDVVQLTGFSHLCPNRILCMTLDIYEQRLSESNPAPLARPLLALMRRFPSKRLTEAVNFQLLAHSPAVLKPGSRPLPAPSTPSQFLAVAALIAQGLVNLDDVWSYLGPTDDALKQSADKLMAKYDKELSDVSKVDLEAGSAKKEKDTFQSLFQEYNQATHQKFRLAAALISVNCWWAAHKVLLHLRALCKPCLNHYVREALCDLLKWLIAPLLLSAQKRLPHQTKATLETTYGAERRFGLGLEASETPAAEGASNGGDTPAALRQAKDLDQFIPQAKQVLEHLEYFLHKDVHLLSSLWKVMGIFVRHREKAEKAEKPEKRGKVVLEDGAVNLIYKHLLPAASLVPNNCYLGDLIWSVMSQLNEFQRSLIYSCWDTMYDSFLLKFAYEKAKVATKQILKRVVANADRKDLIAHQAHFHISKLCSSNPIPVLEVMLKDVEIGFNVNMIQPYVECTNRCSELTADVMSFIFSRCCNRPLTESRKFLNQSDAMLSPWLHNLGEFVGRFYKKHPHTDMNGLLQVVTKRINSEVVDDSGESHGMAKEYKGESLIRVILESLIEHMGGYLTVADMNVEQLLCLAGGPRLKSESVSVGKKEDASRKDRARQALFTTLVDLNLVPVLWHSLGQQRHHFLSEGFSEANSGAGGTKLLGVLFDGNHECFLKVTEFLTQACSREKYMALLPPLRTVFSIFEPALAFLAVRHGLPPYGIPISKAKTEAAALADAPAEGAPTAAAEAVVETAPELKDLDNVVRFYLPEKFESEGLSLLFYTTFWRLSLQDISMPESSYEKAIKGLDEQIKVVEKQKKELEYKRDRDHSREYKNLKKEVNRLQEVITKLKEEKLSQAYSYQRVRARLDKEKRLWFTTPSPAATAAFVAEMICPRVLTSHADALFCCHFVRLLIDLKTPGFQLLDFYNSWTIMLTQCIRCCSEREAQIFGVFLREMMSYVIELRKDEAAYIKASKDNPAFYRNYHDPEKDDPGTITMTAYADLLKGHAKWEGRIYKAMKQGLDSDDWMEKRNMLLMLSQSTESFPNVYKYGQQILVQVEALRDKEDNEHQDIKTLARSLAVKLTVQSEKWVDRPPPGEKDAAKEKDAKRAKDGKDRDRDGKREDGGAEKRPRREDDPGEKPPRESRDGRDGKSDKAKPAKEKDGREPKDPRPAEKDRGRARDAEKPREKDRDAPRESSKAARDKDSDRKRSSQLQPAPPPPHSGDRRPPSAVVDDRHEKRRRTDRDAGGDHRGSSDRHGGRDGGGHRNALTSAPASRSQYQYDDRPRYDSRSGGGYGSSRHSDYPPRR